MKPRSMDADSVTEDALDVGFVVGKHMFHPVPEFLQNLPAVFDKTHRGVPVCPSSLFLQCLREIPVVET